MMMHGVTITIIKLEILLKRQFQSCLNLQHSLVLLIPIAFANRSNA